MDCTGIYIPYSKTGSFSPLVLDYLANHPQLQPFYRFAPNVAGIEQAILQRQQYPVNRQLLAGTLEKQYKDVQVGEDVQRNIAALRQDNTYTVCTAHQPNLLTGYLYFIYKIAHAISLTAELNRQHPDKHFVPVYYMGSEDNDLDELGRFNYNGQQYRWDAAGQKGAVGRMHTEGLEPLLDELFSVLGPPGEHAGRLKDMLRDAYAGQRTVAGATRFIVNELFGKYGLIVVDADDAGFKSAFAHIMQDDLLNHHAHQLAAEQGEELSKHYTTQAYPREINLFYLQDGSRERIERDAERWTVVNAGISWSEEELLKELHDHPEHFSPNVILRGLLQETILPDVAFIGGGAEVAYWLQLEKVFAHYKAFYPPVLLRQSVLWIEPAAAELQKKLGLSAEDIFKTGDELVQMHLDAHSNGAWKTEAERQELEQLFAGLKNKATSLDPTLASSAEAALAKMYRQLQVLEKKMKRAEKRKRDTELQRYVKLRSMLFPGGSLQERKENFIQYYPMYGQEFIDVVCAQIKPLQNEFLVIFPPS